MVGQTQVTSPTSVEPALTTSLEVIGTAITHKDDNLLDEKIRFSAAKDNATYLEGTPT
jgi:hypothetical protein